MLISHPFLAWYGIGLISQFLLLVWRHEVLSPRYATEWSSVFGMFFVAFLGPFVTANLIKVFFFEEHPLASVIRSAKQMEQMKEAIAPILEQYRTAWHSCADSETLSTLKSRLRNEVQEMNKTEPNAGSIIVLFNFGCEDIEKESRKESN